MRFQVACQVFHLHPIYPCRSFVALYSLQRRQHVSAFKHCLPYFLRFYVGFSIVACWVPLGALNFAHWLHLLRWFISLSFRGFLPSLFVPQTAHCTLPLIVQPFPKKKLPVLWLRLTPANPA